MAKKTLLKNILKGAASRVKKVKKAKKKIELRGRKPKTNPQSSPATRRIAQVGKDPKLKGTGGVKSFEMRKVTSEVRSDKRKRGVSNPQKGLFFRDQALKKRRKKILPVAAVGGAAMDRRRGGKRKPPKPKLGRPPRTSPPPKPILRKKKRGK